MIATPLLLGIDIGTTSIKSVLYDPHRGTVAHIASRPTPVMHPRPEWTEWDPHALWETTLATVRDVLARVDHPARVAAIGITSVGETGIALDARGNPLRPIIAWFDPRGEEYVEHWARQYDGRRVYQITGHFPRTIYTAFKLLWLREHEPDVFARLAHWLFVGDYIAYRLTGEMATVPTLAARSLLFDVVRRTWSESLLAGVGLRAQQMPSVISSTRALGRLQPECARALGLSAGLPVALGGHDHVVGMWLAGITLPGRAVDSSGTAQGIAVEVPQFIGEKGYEAQLTCYPMAVGDTFILQGGMPTAGAALQWLADLIAGGDVKRLLAWARESEPGSRGVGVIPFLRGPGPPYRQSQLRGVFYQIDLAAGPADMARALVEGLACFLTDVVQLLERVSGTFVQEVRAIGGVNRDPFVLQVKATMLNRPIARVEVPEVVGTGAALLGGIVCGYFPDPVTAVNNVRVDVFTVPGEPQWRDTYTTVLRRYQAWIRAALTATAQEASGVSSR